MSPCSMPHITIKIHISICMFIQMYIQTFIMNKLLGYLVKYFVLSESRIILFGFSENIKISKKIK